MTLSVVVAVLVVMGVTVGAYSFRGWRRRGRDRRSMEKFAVVLEVLGSSNR
jgi:hypothetical protein